MFFFDLTRKGDLGTIFHSITNLLNFPRLNSSLAMDQLMKNNLTRRIGRSPAMLVLLGLVLGLTSVLGLASTAMATPFPGASVEPVVWLDAGVGVITGDTFTWVDQSDSDAAHDAMQADALRQPDTADERCQRDARGTVRFDRRRR